MVGPTMGVSLGSDVANTVRATPTEQSVRDLIENATQRVEVILNLVAEYEERIHGPRDSEAANAVVAACPGGMLDSARRLGHLVDTVHERLGALLPSLG